MHTTQPACSSATHFAPRRQGLAGLSVPPLALNNCVYFFTKAHKHDCSTGAVCAELGKENTPRKTTCEEEE